MAAGTMALLLATGCSSDWRDGIAPQEPSVPIAFAASVAPSVAATRADGSLVNRLETALFATTPRTYYYADENGDTKPIQEEYAVGLFGAYTAGKAWQDYVADGQLPTANYLWNQPMRIAAATGGVNALTYAPAEDSANEQDSVRFWPNAKRDAEGDYERVSFWAYYPWTPTNKPYISVTPDGVGRGKGMGTIRVTMHPDASEQSDFMLSDLVADCSKDQYPLQKALTPKPVQLRFHHMLAQVRLYAFIRGTDKIVWAKKNGHTLTVVGYDDEGKKLTLSDGTSEYVVSDVPTNTYVNQWGVTGILQAKDSIPDDWPFLKGDVAVGEPKSVRWKRTETLDVTGRRKRTTARYAMSFNNIRTECDFTPHVTYDADAKTYKTSLTVRDVDYTDVGTLGSATVNHYIMNPYWFRWDNGERVMLNETYMYDYFEDTKAYDPNLEDDNSGRAWTKCNEMNYQLDDETKDPDDARGHQGKHFNYAPGNILLCVPQVLNDNDVPHVVLEGIGSQVKYEWKDDAWTVTDVMATGDDAPTDKEGHAVVSGKVTINMLNMNLKWEPGFIYSYAFLDGDLKPGDDKVKGPESIAVVFDPTKQTDQW